MPHSSATPLKRALWAAVWGIILPLLGACRGGPPPAPPLLIGPTEQELAQMPMQFAAQLQVIELRESPPAGETPFPAPGFRLQEGVVLPTSEPGTLAGLELTPDEFNQWAQKLKEARAVLHMAPEFTIWPGSPAGNKVNTEVPYIANWVFRGGMGVPQRRSALRGTEVSLRPQLIEGGKDALMSVSVSWNMVRLKEFQVRAPVMAGSKQIAGPIDVELPEKRAQSLATAFPMRDGSYVVAAHFVRQSASPETGRAREHFFYVVAVRRIGGEPDPSVRLVPLPERHELSLSWLEWGRSADEAGAPESIEAAAAAASTAEHVDAWTYGLICAPETPASWNCAESSAGVTGIQTDEDKTRRFAIEKLSAGGLGEVKLKLPGPTPGALLTAQLDGAPEWVAVSKTQDALLGEGQEEHHFQAGRQFTAQVEQPLTPDGGWVRLETNWTPRLAGGPPEGPTAEAEHFAAVRLRTAPLKAKAATAAD